MAPAPPSLIGASEIDEIYLLISLLLLINSGTENFNLLKFLETYASESVLE